jgi:uncharacterized FAD-dependent dehydrogenase
MEKYDCVVVGSGPAGLGAVFHLNDHQRNMSILVLDRHRASTGGLRNDCKMNFTFPAGFPLEYWNQEGASRALAEVSSFLNPPILPTRNISTYKKRAENIGVELFEINQAHLGTDGGILLIKELMKNLRARRIETSLGEEMLDIEEKKHRIITSNRDIQYGKLIIAPGRKGFGFLQSMMDKLNIPYIDNVIDVGLRIETRERYYPIVRDYYDPKFFFPNKVRTFCTNSGRAYVVKEKYYGSNGKEYFSVNGHAYSSNGDYTKKENGMVNFALLKVVRFTEPLASGNYFAEMLGQTAMLMGGGRPLMQRVGDFRLGKRSKVESFSGDLYDFEPTLKGCTPGDIALAMPAKILRAIWRSMKLLDTIIPGVLHPSTIMYYPEIKLYANKPRFIDEYFQAKEDIYLIGDGAGTSRGITAAWASGIRAASGILEATDGSSG